LRTISSSPIPPRPRQPIAFSWIRSAPAAETAVYATGLIETLKSICSTRDIWPDFTVIPTPDEPWLVMRRSRGKQWSSGTEDHDAAIHSAAVGYLLDSGRQPVFTGDTGKNDALGLVNRIESQVPHHRSGVFRQGPLACELRTWSACSPRSWRSKPVYARISAERIELTMQEIEELQATTAARAGEQPRVRILMLSSRRRFQNDRKSPSPK
jgi:hypothetical protein